MIHRRENEELSPAPRVKSCDLPRQPVWQLHNRQGHPQLQPRHSHFASNYSLATSLGNESVKLGNDNHNDTNCAEESPPPLKKQTDEVVQTCLFAPVGAPTLF